MYTGGEDEYLNEELTQSVNRYESMIKSKSELYFDIHELEAIFDFYFNQKKYQAAKDVLVLGQRFHPDSEVLKLKEAQIFIERGDGKKALKLIEIIEPIDRNNEQLYLIKGSAYLLQDETDAALEAYLRALEISEEPEEWVLNISYAFQRLAEFDKAVHVLNIVRQKNQLNEEIVWELAVCYEQSGKDELSIKTYKEFLDMDPFSDAGWFNLGVILNQTGHYTESIEAFDYVLAIAPDFNAALFNKANALANDEQHDLAIQNYAEFLMENENHPQALCYIGDSYEKMKKYGLAIQYYRKARSVDPAFSESWYGLANLMHNQGHYYEAMYYIRKALSLRKKHPDYLFLAGEIFESLEFYEDAISFIEELVKQDPDDEEATSFLKSLKRKYNESI